MASKVAIGFASVIAVTALVAGFGSKIAMDKLDEAAERNVSDLAGLIEMSSEGEVRITYGAVSNNLYDREIVVEDVALKMPDGTSVFVADEVGLSAEGGVKDKRFPHQANLRLHGVEAVHESARDRISSQWGENFVETPLDVAVSYSYNAAGDLITPALSFSGSGLPGIDATVTLSNVRGIWNVFESNYAAKGRGLNLDRDGKRALRKQANVVWFNEADFTYTSSGELDAWLDSEAKEAGISTAELKKELPATVEYYLEGKPYAPDVLAFLQEPKNISVSVAPDQPIIMDDFATRVRQLTQWRVQSAVQDLNITVEANQPL